MDNLVEKRQSPSEDDLEKIYAEFEVQNAFVFKYFLVLE